ncbi:unnamed protein product [Staurois parvus]|uniref:Uncharacterized protein n=1 Tax=Staurois parvus TaxID=386267 RepID=A0ABN9GU00_9NEOB|nr:unnamed protein product [Staurois parvus]
MTVPDFYEIIKQHREQVDGLMEKVRAIGKDGWTPFYWLGSGFGSVFSWIKGIAVSIVMRLLFVLFLYLCFKCLLYCIARAIKPQNTN